MNSTPPTAPDELYRCSKCGNHYEREHMEKIGNQRPCYCVGCKRAMNRESYRRHRDEFNKRNKTKRKLPEFKEAQMRAQKNAYLRYPEKAIARSRLRYAVKNGKIEKADCQVCGSIKVEAHHYLGYDEEHWYDVQWLCRPHHRDIHKFSLRSRGLLHGQVTE